MDEKLGELIRRCIKDDPAAQKELYDMLAPQIMGICIRYTKSRYDADDVFQEAFIRIYGNLSQFKGEGSFEGWAKRIAVNTALKNFKVNEHENNHLDIDDVKQDGFSVENILSEINSKELLTVINELPEGYKMVFSLYVIEGYTHKEIAKMLKISEGTSKSQFFYAKKMLQKLLQDYNIEENG